MLEAHELGNVGLKPKQIAERMGTTRRTASRMLAADPEKMRIDGTRRPGALEPHGEEIRELMKRGFRNSQILKKLTAMYPDETIKRSTLDDFCGKVRAQLFENGNSGPGDNVLPSVKAPDEKPVHREQPGGRKNRSTQERQASQLKRREKVLEIHLLKEEGYTSGQIAKIRGIGIKTAKRMMNMDPGCMCVDGTQTREKPKLLDPHKAHIYELIERGFKNSQILKKLAAMHPGEEIKRSTLDDFCGKARAQLFEYAQSEPENPPVLADGSILAPYAEKIGEMLADRKSIAMIFASISAFGYSGSYSLLQQYCHKLKPTVRQTKKETVFRSLTRNKLASAIWSGAQNDDLDYVADDFPLLDLIGDIVSEFRIAYSAKDVVAVQAWCLKYASCDFPPIVSFINGIHLDRDAFFNSLMYDYSNGLLEGSVNKLKSVKRSMYGRAKYPLLRAKLLLANSF